MKTRILYVGTLIDLALIFEPDEEPESDEVFQSMLNNNNTKGMAQRKEKSVEKEQPKRLAILLRTMVNGYMLEVNNEGYMYFNAQSLLEGFLVHVGMERLEAMTKEEIKTMVEAVKDGSAIKKLQAEVTELKNVINDQKKEIREQKRVIKDLKKELNIED